MAKKIEDKKRLNEQGIKFVGSSHCNQVNNAYTGHPTLADERNKVPIFQDAWKKAVEVSQLMGKDQSDESLAKCSWTIDNPPFYKLVNDKLREWHEVKSPDILFPFDNYVKLLEKQCEKLPQMRTFYRGIDNMVK